MALRIIAKLLGQRRDRDHYRERWLFDNLRGVSRSLQIDIKAIREARKRSAVEIDEAAVTQYLSTLSKTEQMMLKLWWDDFTTPEIAQTMNLESETVARTLGKIYAGLRFLNHNQPTNDSVFGLDSATKCAQQRGATNLSLL